MQSASDERSRELCKRNCKARDVDEVLKLVQQLNQELEERRRLSQQPDSADKVRQS